MTGIRDTAIPLPTLVVATGNAHKLREIAALVAPWQVAVSPASEFGVGDVPETGETFEDNAVIKASAGFVGSGRPCLADDSGLAVDALGGAPGVYSARYAGPGADDATNNRKLIAALADVEAARRGAHFVSAVALVLATKDLPGQLPAHVAVRDLADGASAVVVRGEVSGRIIDAPRGAAGFGYDPHFLYLPAGKTFAEMPTEAKLAVSHRGQAMDRMTEVFEALFGT